MAKSLTPRTINALKPNGKRQEIRFSDSAGLLIRMGATGDMSWNFKRKIKGENFRATMGPVLTTSDGKVDPVNVENAKIWAAEMRKLSSEGVNIAQVKREAREAPTMEQLWEMFLNSNRFADKASSSQEGDKRTWHDHIEPYFKGTKVENVDRAVVKAFLDATYVKVKQHKNAKNGRRANDVRALLSTMFTEAISLGYVNVNPVSAVKPRKIAPRDKFQLTDAQRKTLLSEAYGHSEEMGLIVEIAMTTGLRKANILQAQWQEIGEGVLTISGKKMKGKRQHSAALPEGLRGRLENWRKRLGVVNSKGDLGQINRASGYIFPSTSPQYEKGRRDSSKAATPEWERPHRASIKTAWAVIKKRADLEGLRFHDLRHDYATSMAKAGMTPYNLQRLMAHEDSRTTQQYIDIAALDAQRDLVDARAASLSDAIEENKASPEATVVNLRP